MDKKKRDKKTDTGLVIPIRPSCLGGDHTNANDGAQAPDDELAELAEMSPLEYGRRREAMADDLGTSLHYLDLEWRDRRKRGKAEDDTFLRDPEPWPDPVDGADLLNEIRDAAAAHIMLPDGGAEIVALWVLFAHLHDCFDISPMLAFTSATPACGKSTGLNFLSLVTPRALSGSNISPWAVFRSVEKWTPTLLADELDTFVHENAEIRGILNCGHMRNLAFVLRVAGETHDEVRRFHTWAPKALAMIGKLPATLASRSLHITLKRMLPGDHVEPLRYERTPHLDILKRKAARWAVDNTDAVQAAEPEMPKALSGRPADNWRPMIAIADQAGGDWPERTRLIAETFGAGDDAGASVKVLEDLRDIFAEKGVELLKSEETTEALGKMEHRPWPEWKNQKPITTRQLAKLLEPFEIAPKQHWLTGGTNRRGYHVDQFKDAFKRWLGGDFAAMPLEPNEGTIFSESLPLEPTPPLADREAQKPLKPNASSGIAAKNPLEGGMRDSVVDKCPQCGQPGKLVMATDGTRTARLHRECVDSWTDDWPELPAFLDRRKRVS